MRPAGAGAAARGPAVAERAGLRLDAWSHGGGTLRDVPVRVGDGALEVEDLRVPLREIFWTSRRAGLLIVFSERDVMALRGSGRDLDRVARELETHVSRADQRRRLPDDVTTEGVLCTAGVAAVGRVGGAEVRGLRLAVVTRRALHLLGAGERRSLPWPAAEVRELEAERAGGRGPALEVGTDGDRVRLLYLFPEELRLVARAARGQPEASGPELELFARRDVAPPVAAQMPALLLNVDVLQELAEETTGKLPLRTAERTGLGSSFFETHFLELGEVALGPLLLRKSAASGAGSLARAVEAMDADELQEDTRAAVSNAAARVAEAYDRQLRGLLRARRASSRMESRYGLSEESREEIRLRILGPFERLVPLLRRLEEQQRELSERLERVEAGPPEAEEGPLRKSLDAWKRTLRKVDAAYEEAWRAALGEIREVWGTRLLPVLVEVAAMRRRRIPEWVQLALIAVLALLAAAAITIWLVW